jgi:uncharacterized protein with NAD-binding domain and iron-sulfur cluster
MTKQRIAIVGGGMAALATAFELTQREDLRERFDITIYQMGWRLGGKGATGRDHKGRVVEHGLHIWFGCYENAFRMLRTAYEEWKPFRNEKQAIKSCDAALKAQRDSAIGAGDSSDVICLSWPRMPGEPGVDAADLSPLACFSQMLHVMHCFYQQLTQPNQKQKQKQKQKPKQKSADFALPDLPLDDDTAALLHLARIEINNYAAPKDFVTRTQGVRVPADQFLALARDWARQLKDNAGIMNETQLRSFVALLRNFAKHVRAAPNFADSSVGKFLSQLIDVGTAAIKGVVADIMIEGTTIEDLDLMDFREWLAFCGAARESIYGSPIVQALYDSMLEYCDGDKRRPSYGAGTAAQAVFRLYGTYMNSFAFEMQSGMGEVVVTPIYKVLEKRGVKFEFFMKLKQIKLDSTKSSVAQIVFDRQVRLCNGSYEPTIPPGPCNGYLECWPDEPRWEQLCGGKQLAEQGLDFESYWCSYPYELDEVTLRRGHGFDIVVLAIPLGAFKKLNGDPRPCDELIEACEKFRTMTETATLVPSLAVQAWSSTDTAGLGWPPTQARPPGAAQKTVMSTGPEPLDIWADMSQVLDYEPRDRLNRPKSLHYLCGVIETDLFRAPSTQNQVPTKAKARARAEAVDWFRDKARYIWPKSSPRGSFDWDVLFDPNGAKGSKRVDAQVYRVNVDPSSCCVASAAGSTRWRLATDASGFDKLYFAGTWIDTGFNTECIEAAVISGMQAARAISGASFAIRGEDFLRFRNDLLSLIVLAAESGIWLLKTVVNAAWSSSSAEIHRRHIAHRSANGKDRR